MYRETDIKHETTNYWVLAVGPKGFEVYRKDLTHSVRVAQIGYTGEKGLNRAIAECNRREEVHGK